MPNLKKKKSIIENIFDDKILIAFMAITLVVAINYVVFSVLLYDRDKIKAFDATTGPGLFVNIGNQAVIPGQTDVLMAEFWFPDAWAENQVVTAGGGCDYTLSVNTLGANPCMQQVDSDGIATLVSGGTGANLDDDGISKAYDFMTYPQYLVTPAENICADVLDPNTAPIAIKEVYIDGNGDCTPGNGGTDIVILDADGIPGLSAGAWSNVGNSPNSVWVHSEVVNQNNAFDYCGDASHLMPCGPAQTETLWAIALRSDTVLAQGNLWLPSTYIAGQWQGDPFQGFGSIVSIARYTDINSNNRYDGLAAGEAIILNLDQDPIYEDQADILFEADGISGCPGLACTAGSDDDFLAPGTSLTPLLVTDNVCLNSFGFDGTPVIIFVDGTPPPGNCDPTDAGGFTIVRDDTGSLPVAYISGAVYPFSFYNAAGFLSYADAGTNIPANPNLPNIGAWDYGLNTQFTESLWLKIPGNFQFHPNIELTNTPIEADGMASPGIGSDDDMLTRGLPLSYITVADRLCFAFDSTKTFIEDMYIDQTLGPFSDCNPYNDTGVCWGMYPASCLHPYIIYDNGADGLNPASTFNSITGAPNNWISAAGSLSYSDSISNGAWDYCDIIANPLCGLNPASASAATETLWLEAVLNLPSWTGGADTDVYSNPSAIPIGGDLLASNPRGPNNYLLRWVDANSDTMLDNSDTIVEDIGTVDNGSVNNNRLDRQTDFVEAFTFTFGTQAANNSILNLNLSADINFNGICDTGDLAGALPLTSPATSVSGLWEYNPGFNTPIPFPLKLCLFADIDPTAIVGTVLTPKIPIFVDGGTLKKLNPGDTGFLLYANPGSTFAPAPAPYTITIGSGGGGGSDHTPPGPPTDVSLTADSTGIVTITWTDPADSDLKLIIIQDDKSTPGTISNTISDIVGKGIEIYTDSGLTVGQTYLYQLSAKDYYSNISEPTEIFSITIPEEGVVFAPDGEPIPGPEKEAVGLDTLPDGIEVGDLLEVLENTDVSIYSSLYDISTIYLVTEEGTSDIHAYQIRPFPSAQVWYSYYTDFNVPIKEISATVLAPVLAELMAMQDGRLKYVTVRSGTYLIAEYNNPDLYAVEPGGIRRLIPDEQVTAPALYGQAYWNSPDKVINLAPEFMQDYLDGSEMTADAHATGTVIKDRAANKIYYIEDSIQRLVTSSVFAANKFQYRFVIDEPDVDLAGFNYEPGSPLEELAEFFMAITKSQINGVSSFLSNFFSNYRNIFDFSGN